MWIRVEDIEVGDYIKFFGWVVAIDEIESEWAGEKPIGMPPDKRKVYSSRGSSAIWPVDEEIQVL